MRYQAVMKREFKVFNKCSAILVFYIMITINDDRDYFSDNRYFNFFFISARRIIHQIPHFSCIYLNNARLILCLETIKYCIKK